MKTTFVRKIQSVVVSDPGNTPVVKAYLKCLTKCTGKSYAS